MLDAVNGGQQPAPAPTNGSIAEPAAGFGSLHIGPQRVRAKKYQPRGRRFRHGLCAAAVRAITAARIYLEGKTTLTEAAFKCGSNPTYVKAAIVLLKSEDARLFRLVVHGHMSLLVAARRARPVVELVDTYNKCSVADLATAGQKIGPAKVWDSMISPVI